MWTAKSSEKEADECLEQVEQKSKILDFMIDFSAHQRKYRSRVTSTLIRLLDFDDWRAAVDADPSVRAAVREITDDPECGTTAKVFAHGVAVNLRSAALAAES